MDLINSNLICFGFYQVYKNVEEFFVTTNRVHTPHMVNHIHIWESNQKLSSSEVSDSKITWKPVKVYGIYQPRRS